MSFLHVILLLFSFFISTPYMMIRHFTGWKRRYCILGVFGWWTIVCFAFISALL